MMQQAKATRQQVEEVMGRLDDIKLAEIIEIGASPPELLEAKRWLLGYKRTVPDDLPVRPSVIGKVLDIMKSDEPDWYNEGVD